MKTYKVYLNIYDFLSCNRCLDAVGLGAYHTGIQIGDIEYCYSVCSVDPKDSGILQMEPEGADYSFNRKIFLGEVTIMKYRLTQIIQQLAEEYTCGQYHMFNNNCNHFSNDLAKRLAVSELPKYIFRATNWLGYLCCCLPDAWMNGQQQLKRLIEQQQARRERQDGSLIENQK